MRSNLPETTAPEQGLTDVRVHLISLGCPKNLVDSELILGNVGNEGLAITSSAEDADIIVVNTCGFVDAAKEESIQTILEACALKRDATLPKRVVVTGCLAQRYGAELQEEIPEVDAILGLGEYDDIGTVLRDLSAQRQTTSDAGGTSLLRVGDPDKACNAEVGRFRLTPSHYAYLKISEGCDNPCTFCAIPSMRGRFRSKSIAMIEDEARELVASGAKELVLISQDTTSYGVDLTGRFELSRLLEALAAIDGVEWIRILYAYPAFLTDDMIDSIASIDKVVKYLDMPLQHISDTMLRRMGRRMDERKTRELLERTRAKVPGIYLRTTFIVGFPGESAEDFATLRNFVEEFQFERLGVFTYSEEEGTPSAAFAGQVPQDLREARLEEIMVCQQAVAFDHNRRRIGSETRLLVDRVGVDEGGKLRLEARSQGEAPEIDQVVLLGLPQAEPSSQEAASRSLRELPVLSRQTTQSPTPPPGAFVQAKIVGSRGYDLLARLSK